MTNKKIKLEENVHYYYNEEGLVVLTALYLKNRGYCCGNRCDNCPYEGENLHPKLRGN